MPVEPSKKMRVGVSSSAMPINAAATPKIMDAIEAVALPTSSSSPTKVPTSELPTERVMEVEKKKKKKKLAVVKIGHQLITNIKVLNHMKLEVVKAEEDHQAKVACLLKEKVKVDRRLKERLAEVEGLRQTTRDAEQASTRSEEKLAFEVEKRRKMEAKMGEKE
ncbi:hypothetical protein COCNU_scaffold004692G000020 [Cocos nucifera]|nr:hypothetical protein [Cocos nucifera]